MTALDLDALLALREQATCGEWEYDAGKYDIFHRDWTGYAAIARPYYKADAALIVAAVNALPELVERAREADRLRQWKAEAIAVIEGWEDVFDALGRPGRPGQLKSVAVLDEADRLRAEVERLRAVVEAWGLAEVTDEGLRLRVARDRRGVRQGQLARQIGVSQSTLAKMERGDVPVDPERLAMALDYLDALSPSDGGDQ